jgi:hypothetical protein
MLATPGLCWCRLEGLCTELRSFFRASVGACATNPEAVFNPGSKKEPKQLQKLTNMANGNITAGKYDGPGIHATAAGYKQLAKEMILCH